MFCQLVCWELECARAPKRNLLFLFFIHLCLGCNSNCTAKQKKNPWAQSNTNACICKIVIKANCNLHEDTHRIFRFFISSSFYGLNEISQRERERKKTQREKKIKISLEFFFFFFFALPKSSFDINCFFLLVEVFFLSFRCNHFSYIEKSYANGKPGQLRCESVAPCIKHNVKIIHFKLCIRYITNLWHRIKNRLLL